MAGYYYTPNMQPPQQWAYNRPVAPQPVYQQPVYVAPQVQAPVVMQQQAVNQRNLPEQYLWLTRPVKSDYSLPQPKMPFMPQQTQLLPVDTSVLATPVLSVAGPDGSKVPRFPFKNDLKQLMQNNQAVIEAIVIRTFGAKDKDKDGIVEKSEHESGTFLNAINRLDELKNKGINTLHVLPVFEVGQINKLGEAGSIYAPSDYNKIAKELDTPGNGLTVKDEMKVFINECHKRGIRVMIDLPSCGSVDMTQTNPEWFLRDRKGDLKVPGTWRDIRMFDPYTNRDTGELRQSLMEMHKEFVRNMVDVGVDGIRADVARAKPQHFWTELIGYSQQLDPNFGWLAESYIHEDASPMANIPADRPEELLKSGFDCFYGQYHILQSMKNASEVHKYIIDNLKMTQEVGKGKSMIGSFYTHDDKSVMNHGGALYSQFASTLVSTLPMVNPYYITGFDRGDTQQLDIFNYVPYPKGKHPYLYHHVAGVNKMREEHNDVIGLGHYAPLTVKSANKDDQIMAFVRHYNGKTLLVIANKDVNARHIGKVEVPTLAENQQLQDLVPAYGTKSKIAVQNGAVAVDVAPGRVHVFEINTPSILNNLKEVYRQNL